MEWHIHHVNLEARDVRATAAFYREILGMELRDWVFPESRGYLPGDPDKLALLPDGREVHTGLHLIAPDEDFASKNNMMHNPSKGGHVAFHVPDLDVVIGRLEHASVPFSLTGEFAIPGLRHIYVNDPSGNLIEINGPVGAPSKAVRHLVLCKIDPATSDPELENLWNELRGLARVVPGMRGFQAGPNTSPEGLERGYSHAFSIDFESAQARDDYLAHPDHKAAGAKLVAMCVGGRDGLCVVDI